MNKKLKNGIVGLAMTGMLVTTAACGSSSGNEGSEKPAGQEGSKSGSVTVKYATYSVGVDTGAQLLKTRMEMFPKSEYGTEVKIQLEEIPGIDNYANKMKVLLSVNDLPDIIENTGYNFIDMAAEAGKLIDLTPYFEEDPEWRKQFDEDTIEYNSRDGKIYAVPNGKESIGYFYNKELFEQVGIKPAETWDEFWDNADKLLAAGITPLSMDTAETGWLTSLILGAIVGTDGEAGNQFMNTKNPKDFNTPEMIRAAEQIQAAFQKYTTKDAIGGKYDTGASHFYSGKTAMIFNGPWMIADFTLPEKAPEGFDKKVGVAQYPEGGMVSIPNFGIMVGSKNKEQADAAVKYLKFMTTTEQQLLGMESGFVPLSTKLEYTDEIREKNPLLVEYMERAGSAKVTFGEFQALWYPNVVDGISNLYPELALGKLTPEQFCEKLTELASKNE